MKIPDKIRVGGVDYSINHVEHLNNGEKVCYGIISYDKAIISLHASNQDHQRRCITLWHEVLHAIAKHACLDFENFETKEEQIIEIFSKGIYQVLQDNGRELFDIVK